MMEMSRDENRLRDKAVAANRESERLARELAQCADELAYWKYQATVFHARLSWGVIRPSDEQEEKSRLILEAGYKTEQKEIVDQTYEE